MVEAIISAGAAILVCVITNYFQNRKTTALIEYRLDELSKKVDKHNSVIERTYELEKNQAVIVEDIKVANNRIKDLEAQQAQA